MTGSTAEGDARTIERIRLRLARHDAGKPRRNADIDLLSDLRYLARERSEGPAHEIQALRQGHASVALDRGLLSQAEYETYLHGTCAAREAVMEGAVARFRAAPADWTIVPRVEPTVEEQAEIDANPTALVWWTARAEWRRGHRRSAVHLWLQAWSRKLGRRGRPGEESAGR